MTSKSNAGTQFASSTPDIDVEARIDVDEHHLCTKPASDEEKRPTDSPEENYPSGLEEKRLVRKIDMHLIPILCLLYLLTFLDRVNIANAREFGLLEDLNLRGKEFSTSLTIFFIPYILFEIPSNILMRNFRPNVWLASLMFFFGLTTAFHALTQNFSGLLAARFFLGVFESGILPGCAYIIGMWYKPSEAQVRFSFFFCSASLAGIFGGLLASAIGKMDGVRGYRGWRWIFIIEGLITSLTAILIFKFAPPFPEDTLWLTSREKSFLKKRQEFEQGVQLSEERMTLPNIARVLRRPRVFLGGLMGFGISTAIYSYAYFAPTIIRGFHYSPIQTQLRTVAPWTCSLIFSMLIACISDLTKHRFLYTIALMSLSLAGYAINLCVYDNSRVQYGSLFLIVMGIFSAGPIIVCWFTMNLRGHLERSIGTAWQISFSNLGAILASYSFLPKEAPHYTKGYITCLGFLCFAILCCGIYAAMITSENKRSLRKISSSQSSETTIRAYKFLL